jgi:uncharacterized repeat protein (TIGR01451 family)
MKNSVFIVLIALWLGFVLPPTALAAVRCEQQYGGEVCVEVGELQVNKLVFDPANQRFVDNLDVTDHKFAPGEEVIFRIKVKNVGDAAFEKVTVQDTLPFFLRLSSSSLSFEIFDLTPGETEEREVRARVVGEESFPQNQTVICDVNIAEAQAKEMFAKDTAKVCAAKKVAVVTVLPPTGFTGFPVLLVLSVLLAAAGITLVFLGRR